jgi:hypothetical protein
MIIMVGSKLYAKARARQDKKVEARKSVMADMRRLASLFIHLRAVWQKQRSMETTGVRATGSTKPVPEFSGMFHHRNYDILEEACQSHTSHSDDSTSGENLV